MARGAPITGLKQPKEKRTKQTGTVSVKDHPSVGIWKDREDMKDVLAWLRKIRAPRYDRLGRRRPKP